MNIKIDFEISFGPLDEKVVSCLEQVWGFKLPTSYRNFLLNYNGGRPIKTYFSFKNGQNGSLLNLFFGLLGERQFNLLYYYEVIYKHRIPETSFPIASDQGGNLVLLSVKGQDRGKVYFWDHEQEVEEGKTPDYSNLILISDSFDEFLNSLKNEEEAEMEINDL